LVFLERNHTFIGFDVEVGLPLSICIETFFTLADNFQQQLHRRRLRRINWRPVRLDLSAESAAIQQCFSLTTNQRTVLSAQ
jgi:hypothetical protein